MTGIGPSYKAHGHPAFTSDCDRTRLLHVISVVLDTTHGDLAVALLQAPEQLHRPLEASLAETLPASLPQELWTASGTHHVLIHASLDAELSRSENKEVPR